MTAPQRSTNEYLQDVISLLGGKAVKDDAGGTVTPSSGGVNTTVVYSATQTAVVATGNSGDLNAAGVRELVLDVNVTAISGVGTMVTISLERKDAAGNYVTVFTGTATASTGSAAAATIGIGAAGTGNANAGFGDTVRVKWTIAGATPSASFTVSLKGK